VVVAALSPLSLVLAHNLVFLLSAGDEVSVVLRATGHDATWFSAVRLVIASSAVLGLAAAGRVAVLWRRARQLERETGPLIHAGWRGLGSLLIRTWIGVMLLTTLWFLVQENLERLGVGQAAPLLGPLLDGGLTGALVVIPAVSLLTALVGALFRWGVTALLARITAARLARGRRRPIPARRPAGRIAHPSALLARRLGLRAPPLGVAA
jgi:hypothetical protein